MERILVIIENNLKFVFCKFSKNCFIIEVTECHYTGLNSKKRLLANIC